MALFTIGVNGQRIVVEAPTKAQAKVYGKSLVEVTVEPATAADINANEGDIVTVEKKAAAPAADAKTAE